MIRGHLLDKHQSGNSERAVGLGLIVVEQQCVGTVDKRQGFQYTFLYEASRAVGCERTVKFTKYFDFIRQRPDRALIQEEWISRVISRPVREVVQKDGRIRRWAPIKEMDNRHLRVVLLSDRETVHNAFFDRSFKP